VVLKHGDKENQASMENKLAAWVNITLAMYEKTVKKNKTHIEQTHLMFLLNIERVPI
jgi:hypothetical protein